MGVDSTAILVRWLTDASSRNFPLSALTVLVSQAGDEYPDTYAHTEQVVLPMLRARRVRLVQVARPALVTGMGPKYVVLDDSATPHRLVRAGPARLSDELACNGTVAQVSNRRCSLRWKGEVLDAWIADHLPQGTSTAWDSPPTSSAASTATVPSPATGEAPFILSPAGVGPVVRRLDSFTPGRV